MHLLISSLDMRVGARLVVGLPTWYRVAINVADEVRILQAPTQKWSFDVHHGGVESAATRTKRRIASTADASSLAFRGEPNPGIYTQYSLPLSHAYVPLALIPTATYHQVLRNRLERLGFEWPSRKPSYMVSLPPIGEARLSLKFRVYPPGILSYYVSF